MSRPLPHLARIYKEYERQKKNKKLPAHSIYSPSKSYLWLNCPKSVELTKNIVDEGSEASRAGTEKHEHIEAFLTKYSGISWFRPDGFNGGGNQRRARSSKEKTYNDFIRLSKFKREPMSLNLFNSIKDIAARVFEELQPYVDNASRAKKNETACPQFYEARVFMDSVIPGCYGTADYSILSPRTLYVIDWKFGRVPVDPGSTQLILYAIGIYNTIVKNWLKNFPDLERICNVIVQPMTNKKPKLYYYPIKDLLKYEKQYAKQAKPNLNKTRKAKVGPWCEHYAKCQPYCEAYRKKLVEDTRGAFE